MISYLLSFKTYLKGFSTTHLAALTQNCNAMRLLSRGKADINLPDGKSGRTPLHHAVERDDLSTVGFLILEVCI